MRRIVFVFGLVLLLLPSPGLAQDVGLVLELDRGTFLLSAREEETGSTGPEIPVALGSPGAPTPDGGFPLYWIILNPGWAPGADARAAGAEREAPSTASPMGVAKIPFAEGGAIALHGGGDPLVVGKSVSSGCVRATDADMLRLVAWLDRRGALGAPEHQPDGEVRRPIVRPVFLRIR